MATKGAIAAVRDQAIRDLNASGAAIANSLGIEPPALDMFYRDREYLQAEQLKALAAFMVRLAAAVETGAKKPGKKAGGGDANGG